MRWAFPRARLEHRSASQDGHPRDTSVLLCLLSGPGSIATRINVEDLAYTEHLVPEGVPDPPRNPDPPRYFPAHPLAGLACWTWVVDPGFMVDRGVYCPPDQPHSPNQPR